MDVNLANPKNHYTKAQVEERRAQEASVQKPKSLKCPKWLCPGAAKMFRAHAKELLANLPASTLDTNTLARMCDAEWSYGEASKHKSTFMDIASRVLAAEAEARAGLVPQDGFPDPEAAYSNCQEQIAYWTKQMAAFEHVARGAAADLGCTITSRCRLVVPQTAAEEADPLESLQRELMRIV